MNLPRRSLVRKIGAFAMIGVGIVTLIASGYSWWVGYQTKHWIPADGEVISIQMSPLANDSYRPYSSPQPRIFRATINFSYKVGTKTYVSHNYGFGWLGRIRQPEGQGPHLGRILGENLKEGTKITAYYHPDKPGFGVLKNGYQGSLGGHILTIIAAFGLGGYLLYKD